MRNIIRKMSKYRRDGSNIGVMLNLIQHPLFQGIAGQARNDGARKAPKYRRDNTLFYRTSVYTFITVAFLWLSACEETKRFEISGNDNTPPGQPEFLGSEPLVGGARVFFRPPADEDLLYVEASYISEAGKKLRFSASYFTDSLDVYGFGKEGEHTIELCAVDRAGNRSTSKTVTVASLEPVAVSVAKSVEVLSSFAAMMLKWNNIYEEPVYVWVDLAYTQNAAHREHTTVFTVFNTQQIETRSIESLNPNSASI